MCENESVGSSVGQLLDVAVDLDVAPNNVIYYYNPANLSKANVNSF